MSQRDSNPRPQQPNGCRPTPQTAQPRDKPIKCYLNGLIMYLTSIVSSQNDEHLLWALNISGVSKLRSAPFGIPRNT
jgi:hypothetical protein